MSESDDNKVVPLRIGQSKPNPEDDIIKRVRKAICDHDYDPTPEHTVEVGGYSFRYLPEYETYFIQRAFQCGASLTAISAEIGIPFRIIMHWARKIPALAVALDISMQNSQYYWEGVGRENILDRRFNAGGWLKMMAVQFPQTWRELPEEAKVETPDPYGFDKVDVDEDAEINAGAIFEKLMRIKEVEDEKKSG